MAAGASDAVTFTATYVITQADIDAGLVTNQAEAVGTAPDQSTVSDLSDDNSELEDDPTDTDLCQDSDIALIKEAELMDMDESGCPSVGDVIHYTFTVANLGNTELTNIVITDPLPGIELEGGPIATLAPGAIDDSTFTGYYVLTELDLEHEPDQNPLPIINQATVEGTTPGGETILDLSDRENFEEDRPTIVNLSCAIIVTIPTMTLLKSGQWIDEDSDGSADVGEIIEYTFSVTNDSQTETIYNITIEDPLPGLIIEGGPIEELLPLETDNTTFTATYVITQEDIDNGEVVNQAIVTGENLIGDVAADESDDPSTEELNDPTVVILPIVEPEVTFEIFNGVTPNEDNFNDYFKLDGIENYPNNNVKIYNRWGILVWETNGYENVAGGNVFTGDADARMMIEGQRDAPTGTYFYIITFFGDGPDANPGKKNYSGYLYLNR